MWSSKALTISTALLAMFVSGCTIEPLNASRADSSVASGAVSNSTRTILQQTEVEAVTDRVSQQVRNQLLFAMNGGTLLPNGKYRVKLRVERNVKNVAIETSSRAPTASQVTIKTNYALVDKSAGKTVKQGFRQVIVPYENTPQSFAKQRAQREAENRAAAQMAQQLRLAIAQNLADL